MKQVLLKVLNGLSTIIILVAVLVLLRAVFTTSGEVPSVGGYSVLRVLSGSMEPEIPTNALVLVHEEDPADLEVGDVITFYSADPTLEGALNTHRITAIETDEATGKLLFTTKGDANVLEDKQPVAAASVIGKVTFVSGVLGLLVSLLTNPLVFVPVILVPLFILLVVEIRKLIATAKEVARQEDEAALQEAIQQLREQREQRDREM